MKHLFFLLSILLFTLSFNAQSINKISGKCRTPYTGQVGTVVVASTGDIILTPCPTRTIIYNGGGSPTFSGFTQYSVPFFNPANVLTQDNLHFAFNDTLQSLFLMDSTYTGGSTPGWSQATRQSYLTIGNSSSLVNNTKSVFGAVIDVNRGQTVGTQLQTSGLRVRVNASKTAGTGLSTALEAFVQNVGDSSNGILQAVEGIAQPANNASVVYGGYFSTGGTTGGTGTIFGDLYGTYSTVGSFNQFTVTNAIAYNATIDMLDGVTTNIYGLRLNNWGGSAITNSYGIYADTTIDRGTALKYFIYSLSTSPSSIAGDVYISDNTKGIILQSPDGSCYRYTAANGGALNAGVLVTCP